MIAKAVLRLSSKPNVPYFLCGDFNVDTRDSEVIRAAIADGILVDITLAHGDADNPQATFFARRDRTKV